MHSSKPRWLRRSGLRRGVLPLLILTLSLPAVGIASATMLDSSLVPWFSTGGASETASIGGDYTLTGAAGMAGAHLAVATGGNHTLYGGYVPAQAVANAGNNGSIWLPIINSDNGE